MFIKKLILSSLLLCAAFCCKEDDEVDCSLVDCLGVDNSIYFKVLDKTSGENLFTNGTFEAAQLSLMDTNDNPVAFELQKDFENQDLVVIDLGPNTVGELGFEIALDNIPPFNLTLTTFFGGGSDCCGPYTGVDNVNLTGIESDFVASGTLPLAITILVP